VRLKDRILVVGCGFWSIYYFILGIDCFLMGVDIKLVFWGRGSMLRTIMSSLLLANAFNLPFGIDKVFDVVEMGKRNKKSGLQADKTRAFT
jgi:hypothetical protein